VDADAQWAQFDIRRRRPLGPACFYFHLVIAVVD
jgi:hypothetical protein